MIVSIDFETYSEADIRKVGAWGYSYHPSTEIICMAFSVGTRAPSILTDQEQIKVRIIDWLHLGAKLQAWNSFFEMSICANVLGIDGVLDPSIWIDTAAHAAALALPRSLGECGAALGLPHDKLKDIRGKYLIQRLCKPNRGKRIEHEDLIEEMHEYCKRDVVSEMEIAKRLRPLNALERKVWELDQAINIRGVLIDTDAVDDALAIIEQATEKLNQEVVELSRGVLANVSQRQKVIDFVAALGYPLAKFDKTYLAEVVNDPELPPVAKRLIEIRQMTGKTSLAKYAALKDLATDDNRVRGLLMYHGASTGRWSGKHFQPQNLPRPSFDDTDSCIELFEHRDDELIEMLYDDPMEALSSCLRGMIKAPEGKQLVVADYSAIEARVLAWLAGQEDVLNVFRGDGKIYEHTASQIYKTPIERITKDQRMIGKVATLALGYQGGVAAFQSMAGVYGVTIEDELAERVKDDWRSANHMIVQFWWDINDGALNAVRSPGKTYAVRDIRFRVADDFLFCRLPSGRLLAYRRPSIGTNRFDRDCVQFWGVNSINRKWDLQSTYGGKLVENITQAVARDLMAEAMLRVEAAGFEVVLSVHDELIAECDANRFEAVGEFENLMCQLPRWAEGLPIAAEGFSCKRYRK